MCGCVFLRNVLGKGWRLGVVMILIGFVAGCGKEGSAGNSTTGTVTGMVTLEGAPLAQGEVHFERQGGSKEGGNSRASAPVLGGSFVSPQLEPGTYAISVKASAAASSAAPTPTPTAAQKIPEKYQSAASSGVSIEVKVGNENRVNISMTSK